MRYRSRTIGLLVGGRDAGELAFGQAVAHLRHCRRCQAAHGVDAEALRARFDARAVVFLPGPGLGVWSAGEHGWAWLERLWRALQRWCSPGTGLRERMVEGAAGGGLGVGTKVAGGIAAVAVLAGGAAGVVGTSARGPARVQRRQNAVVRVEPAVVAPAQERARKGGGERARSTRSRAVRALPKPSEQRTAGGFSYLGVPARRASAPTVRQRGGGPFGP